MCSRGCHAVARNAYAALTRASKNGRFPQLTANFNGGPTRRASAMRAFMMNACQAEATEAVLVKESSGSP